MMSLFVKFSLRSLVQHFPVPHFQSPAKLAFFLKTCSPNVTRKNVADAYKTLYTKKLTMVSNINIDINIIAADGIGLCVNAKITVRAYDEAIAYATFPNFQCLAVTHLLFHALSIKKTYHRR